MHNSQMKAKVLSIGLTGDVDDTNLSRYSE
jgi:hypothetical protein